MAIPRPFTGGACVSPLSSLEGSGAGADSPLSSGSGCAAAGLARSGRRGGCLLRAGPAGTRGDAESLDLGFGLGGQSEIRIGGVGLGARLGLVGVDVRRLCDGGFALVRRRLRRRLLGAGSLGACGEAQSLDLGLGLGLRLCGSFGFGFCGCLCLGLCGCGCGLLGAGSLGARREAESLGRRGRCLRLGFRFGRRRSCRCRAAAFLAPGRFAPPAMPSPVTGFVSVAVAARRLRPWAPARLPVRPRQSLLPPRRVPRRPSSRRAPRLPLRRRPSRAG